MREIRADNQVAGTSVREATQEEVADWDQRMRAFGGYRIVHKRAWVESLAASGHGTPMYLVCEKQGHMVGGCPGLIRRNGMLRSFCSPPPGSQTASMGPIFDPQRVTTVELMTAMRAFLQAAHGVNYMEMISRLLVVDEMQRLGFQGQVVKTYTLPLWPDRPHEVLKSFKESARRNVRRAMKLNLETRLEDDATFVDEAYAQIQDVFRRGGHAMSYRRERVEAFFRHMQAAGNLVAISVRLPDHGPSIAIGMFTIEGRELLLWQWAHRSDARWYRPTELMVWTVMQKAMAAGCDHCDLMGGHDFKEKFGAQLDFSHHRWMWSRYPFVTRGRRWAETCYRRQLAWRGRLARWICGTGNAITPPATHSEPESQVPCAIRRTARPT